MLIVEYDKDGICTPDHRTKQFVMDKMKQHDDNNNEELKITVSIC